MTRYSVDPIVRRLGVRLGCPGKPHDDLWGHGYDALAAALGVSRSMARRMCSFGLTERQADHAAIALGTHPALLWPSWWTDSSSGEEQAGWFAEDPPLADLELEEAS